MSHIQAQKPLRTSINADEFQLPVANTRGVPHGPRIILGRPPPPPPPPPQQQQPQRPPLPPKQASATRPPQRPKRPVFTASPPQQQQQQQQQHQHPIKLESITRPSTSSSSSSLKPVIPADPTVGPQLKPADTVAAVEPDKIIFTSPPLDSDDFRASDLAFTAPRVASSPAAAVSSEVVGNGLDHHRHHHRPRLHLPRDEEEDDQLDSGSAPPGFRLRPRGHSAPMIISRVTDQIRSYELIMG